MPANRQKSKYRQTGKKVNTGKNKKQYTEGLN